MSSSIFLIGSGYLSNYIINEISNRNHNYLVSEISRTKKNRSMNISSIQADLDDKKLILPTMTNSKIIYMAPPSTISLEDERLKNFIFKIKNNSISQIIYISTSGVYGNCMGKVVNEFTSTNPITDRAKRRVAAENLLTKYCALSNVKLIILRVPGIYGKGRLPLKRVIDREPLIEIEESRTTNLIHVKDLANITIDALELESSFEIINVSDGAPIKTTQYYLSIYKELNMVNPKFITYSEALETYSEKRLSFLKESRILDTTKMKKILPGCIKYKNIEDGVRESLA